MGECVTQIAWRIFFEILKQWKKLQKYGVLWQKNGDKIHREIGENFPLANLIFLIFPNERWVICG